MGESERRRRLETLITLYGPLSQAVEAVRELPWDYERGLTSVGPPEVLRVFDRFRSGILTAQECAVRANAVEDRDDVDLVDTLDGSLREVLFEISTPELFGEPDETTMSDWTAV